MRAILACEKNGGIGYQGSMPWPKQSKDLARFKELTTGKTVIMGRGTWESKGMPKPLPNRNNIIVTSSEKLLFIGVGNFNEAEDTFYTVTQTNDISSENMAKLKPDWCIGGAKLIDSAWDLIDEIHLSHLREEYECDTAIDLDRLAQDFYCSRSQLCMTHTYEIWKRRNEEQKTV